MQYLRQNYPTQKSSVFSPKYNYMLSGMEEFDLKLIATTDLHMELFGHDYVSEKPMTDRGLLRLKPLIAAQRHAANSILFDNGDFLQGSALADDLIGLRNHPLAELMNELEYDAITLGNHDFDYGLKPLSRFLSQLKMPAVSTNLTSSELAGSVEPWVVLSRKLTAKSGVVRPIKIGVIGLLPPQTISWNALELAGRVQIEDMVIAAQKSAVDVRRAGADIVIALAHTGFGGPKASPNMENALGPLSHSTDIDAIFGGHTHEWHPAAGAPVTEHLSLGSVPIVQPGAQACGIGTIELNLTYSEKWNIIGAKCRNLKVEDTSHEPVHQASEPLITTHNQVRKSLAKPIGKTHRPQTKHYSVIGFDDGVRLAHAAIINLMESTDVEPSLPKIACFASFRSNGVFGSKNYIDTVGGTIRRRDLLAISPFNNPICIIRQNGAQIRNWLSRSSAFYQQIQPLRGGQHLRNHDVPAYHFDQFSGFSYRFDLSQSPDNPAKRVPLLQYSDSSVSDDDLFAIGVMSYRAHGGGNLLQVETDDLLWVDELGVRDRLGMYLSNIETFIPDDAPLWSFSPIEGASAQFDVPNSAGNAPDQLGSPKLVVENQDYKRLELSFTELAPVFQ